MRLQELFNSHLTAFVPVITKLEDPPFQKWALSLTHSGGAARQDAQGILGWGLVHPSLSFTTLYNPSFTNSLSVCVNDSQQSDPHTRWEPRLWLLWHSGGG